MTPDEENAMKILLHRVQQLEIDLCSSEAKLSLVREQLKGAESSIEYFRNRVEEEKTEGIKSQWKVVSRDQTIKILQDRNKELELERELGYPKNFGKPKVKVSRHKGREVIL